MLFNRTIHIVSHTHWDREWYFSTCDSLVLLDPTINDILLELEQNKQVNFCLDGQVSILEDYLKLYPQKLSHIQKLVKEKRLFIGPWYTQSDTQLVGGQSIVGNLYYGIYRSLQLVKDYMKIGYLPDTFGFCNQMPMIMQQFNIDSMIFWRGVDFKKQQIEPYFKWVGQDDSEVSGVVLHNGYGMAKGLNTSDAFVHNKLVPLVEEYKQLTTTQDILIPVGNDQNNIVLNLDQKIAAISDDLIISDYATFIEKIKPQITTTYQGEFREVAYSRIHKTCGGIRIDIKMSNYEAEMALTKELEPLNVMASFENANVSNQLIQEAWKRLYEGQAHDGIVGCVSDSVAQDIVNRNKQALEIAKSAQNYIKHYFSSCIHLKDKELLIFNVETTAFKGYKTVEIFSNYTSVEIKGVLSQSIIETIPYAGNPHALVEKPEGNFYEVEKPYYLHRVLIEVELPSFGYKVFSFEEKDCLATNQETIYKIQNDQYEISFENNQIYLSNKETKICDFIRLYNRGNDGDTYDFSPLKEDKELTLQFHAAEVVWKENVQIMTLDCSAMLPKTLKDRSEGIYNQECQGKIEIQLRKDTLIYVKVEFDNQVLSHQLRIAFKGFQKSGQTMAATPYGSVIRNVANTPFQAGWEKEYVEYPVDVETNSGFVSFYGDKKQLVVFNKGIKEYQAIEDKIYMTLFSSCGELGKPDLLYRPGRASGDTTKKGHIRIQTPRAQVVGTYTFEFAIAFLENEDELLYEQLGKFESANIFYQNQNLNLFYERIDNKIQLLNKGKSLPKEQSYLTLEGIFVFGIYTSLYDDNYKLRIMSFKDIKKQDLCFSEKYKIGNLLEQGDETKLAAYRLYTLRGIKNEDK